jgi:hypothetical protein
MTRSELALTNRTKTCFMLYYLNNSIFSVYGTGTVPGTVPYIFNLEHQLIVVYLEGKVYR